MSPAQQNRLTVFVKRFLDVIRVLFLAVAVIWPIAVLVVGISMSSDPEQRHADINLYLRFHINSELSNDPATISRSESERVLDGRGEVRLNNTQSRLGWYLSGTITEALLLIFLYGLLTMHRLFASLAEGSTFTERNAERLRKIGYVFIAFHIISPVLQYLGSRIMLRDIALNVPGIELFPAFELNMGGLFAGFAIIVLSGVLREAASIHQDQSLTI